MPKKSPIAGKQASDEFVLAYGDALMQWSNLEIVLAIWFRVATIIPHWEMAYSVFFSARSFQGRADMLLAALDHVPDEVIFKTFVQEATLKAIGYNSARNQLAHGFVHSTDDVEPSISNSARYWQSGNVTLKEVKCAANNFVALRKLLYAAHWGMVTREKRRKRGTPLQECLEQLRMLPNEAYSSAPSRKQLGRERQRQAALRSKGTPQ